MGAETLALQALDQHASALRIGWRLVLAMGASL
jgi:hypothetical protein